jgi:hypothetical protein
VIRRKTNRRHMIGDHHGRMAGRATLLVTAADEILGTHTCTTSATSATAKTAPRSAPAADPRSWPPYLIIGILKMTGHANIAAACRHHARDAARTVATLGLSPA